MMTSASGVSDDSGNTFPEPENEPQENSEALAEVAEDEGLREEGEEKPCFDENDDLIPVKPEGKRCLPARILLLVGALLLTGSFFLPFWSMPSSWETPAVQKTLLREGQKPAKQRAKNLVPPHDESGLQILQKGQRLSFGLYGLPASGLLALVLGVLGILGKRIGRVPAFVLLALAIGGGLVGGVLALRYATGILPVIQLLSETLGALDPAKYPGLLLWAVGLLLTLAGGVWAAWSFFPALPFSFRHRSQLRAGDNTTVEPNAPRPAPRSLPKPTKKPSRKIEKAQGTRELTPTYLTEEEESTTSEEPTNTEEQQTPAAADPNDTDATPVSARFDSRPEADAPQREEAPEEAPKPEQVEEEEQAAPAELAEEEAAAEEEVAEPEEKPSAKGPKKPMKKPAGKKAPMPMKKIAKKGSGKKK